MLRKQGEGLTPADPVQTDACCLLSSPASHLLLHNPKTDYLVKKPAETGIFGEVVGAGFLWAQHCGSSLWLQVGEGVLAFYELAVVLWACGMQSNTFHLAGIHKNCSLCKFRCLPQGSSWCKKWQSTSSKYRSWVTGNIMITSDHYIDNGKIGMTFSQRCTFYFLIKLRSYSVSISYLQ